MLRFARSATTLLPRAQQSAAAVELSHAGVPLTSLTSGPLRSRSRACLHPHRIVWRVLTVQTTNFDHVGVWGLGQRWFSTANDDSHDDFKPKASGEGWTVESISEVQRED